MAEPAVIERGPAAGVTGLRVDHLSKTFPGTRALDDVSFGVPSGAIHALLGGNGSGKSTLIKILAGVHTGDPGGRLQVGDAECASDAVTPAWALESGLSFVHQDLGLFDPLTVAESLFSGLPYPRRHGRIDWGAVRRDAERTLERFDLAIDPRRTIAELRPAERTLIAIARALRGRDELHGGLLVLDEPTARLPKAEVDQLLDALRRYSAAGQTILYVSHRLDEVLAVADSVTVLRDGRLVESRPVEGLDEPALGRLIVGRELAQTPARSSGRTTGSETVLEVAGLRGGPLNGVDLRLAAREVVGIAGLVGSGRTSLLETIFGVLPREGGRVTLDGVELPSRDIRAAVRRGVAYLPEDRASGSAFPDLGVAENLSAADPGRFWRGGWWRYGRERADAVDDISGYGIRVPAVNAPLSKLSGGNQQKVMVARWMRRRPRVLLLDEPTQGVDVGARADIYRQIERAVDDGCAVLLVSSDFDELLRLADRVLVLARGVIAAEGRREDIDRNWLVDRIYEASPPGGGS